MGFLQGRTRQGVWTDSASEGFLGGVTGSDDIEHKVAALCGVDSRGKQKAELLVRRLFQKLTSPEAVEGLLKAEPSEAIARPS